MLKSTLRVQTFDQTRDLQRRAHAAIPGGCHTYFKGDDQFPFLSPGFIARGLGSHVWDVDGNEFIEYGMGSRAVGLGHAYEPVLEAVRKSLDLGVNFSRPAAIEVECAEMFLSMIRTAEMVKFTKDGSTATTAALKLARAATGRDLVAVCSTHPFFSYDDWFIGTTAIDAGIPAAVRDMTVTFRYNDMESVQRMFQQYRGQIAAVILEPCKYEHPADNFLHRLQEACQADGAVFVLDEMITGFRVHTHGAQAMYDITPDLSTWGKAMANGFAISALAGKRELMRRGGMDHDQERVFLLSTTHGAETHAMAAAIRTMQIYRDEPVVATLYQRGQQLVDGCRQMIAAHGLQDYVTIEGFPCKMIWGARGPDRRPCQGFRTLMLQELVRRQILAPNLILCYSHSTDDVEQTVRAFDGALGVYREALNCGSYEPYLVGPPSKIVYRKFN
ncbi:MAG: glutamate-1-semialdehyde 2,1-aminomutase [Pirellulales bacterium]